MILKKFSCRSRVSRKEPDGKVNRYDGLLFYLVSRRGFSQYKSQVRKNQVWTPTTKVSSTLLLPHLTITLLVFISCFS